MEWGNLPEFTGKYEVSNTGIVRNLKTGRELKGTIDKDGYVIVGINLCSGEQKAYRVHRLVMMIFNPRENMKDYTVNHINHNKTDNNLSNLEWLSSEDNVKEAWQSGLNEQRCIKVLCVETGEIFPSMRKACQAYGMRISSLQRAINHENYTSKSKHWKTIV